MPETAPRTQHQLIVIQEGVDDAWIFEAQTNIPRMGEEVAIYDPDGQPLVEGRVVNVRWGYIEDNNGSSCTVTLRAESN